MQTQTSKPIEKAWAINPTNFREPHFAPDNVYYSETQGKAKNKILSEIRYDDFEDYHGEKIGFLNLKIKRAPKADRYLVDGVMKTLYQIEYDERVRQKNEAIDKLVFENPKAKAYIKKGCKYYMAGFCGYTEILTNAGVYTIQEAAHSVKRSDLNDFMHVVMIKNQEHNKIEQLKSQLI